MSVAAGRRRQERRSICERAIVFVGAALGFAGGALASTAPVPPALPTTFLPEAALAAAPESAPAAVQAASPAAAPAAVPGAELVTAAAASPAAAPPDAPAGPEPAAAPSGGRRVFHFGVEVDANFRHSDDAVVGFHPPGTPAQETVDPGSHGEISNVSLLADYTPAPLWQAHLRFNGVSLYYRNPTSTDHEYDLAELWLRYGRETAAATVPERPGAYVKVGKFARPERQEDRHLQSYGLVGTAFNLFEDAGVEVGGDLVRQVFVKAAFTEGNPLFIRDTNALAGDTPDILVADGRARLNSGLPILYDSHVERLDFSHPEVAAYLGWRAGEPGGAATVEVTAWGRRRRLANDAELPGSPLGGDLAVLAPLGTPLLPFHGNGKQEVGADLRLVSRAGLSIFAELVDQKVADLHRTGVEGEAAWKIELPVEWAVGGRQLFSYVAPALRWSKLFDRFYNLTPTPAPSLAWDWEKLDGGLRFGLWSDVDLTVEYSYNRTYLTPSLTLSENELLGTLRIRI